MRNTLMRMKVYTVAVPKEKECLETVYCIFNYPQWKLVDCDSFNDAEDMVIHEKSRLFPYGNSQALKYDNNRDFKVFPLPKQWRHALQ